ncbi:G patch domain-containing protein 4-like [Penaeus japonicus]|uniref:G patch domain-containing protein 4-like n=1 Tax=Penaeus japonicus TaxID=27405 RepID=UPI001C713D40|nr:G patch domain-containing protein 4-like [Penaeus japonicus]
MKGSGAEFAHSQLQKYGWKEGKGLGKEETGNTEPLKVKLKFNNSGLGHDIGEEFKFHWWDHVFNKAAKNMTVSDENGSVEINRKEELQVSKKLSSKMNFYNGFVKGGTLHQSEIQKDSDSDDSDDSVERDLSHKLTDEELFKLCGGRTAHKGARHGLGMSAKLARVQEQEQKLMEKWKSTEQPPYQPVASEMSHSQEKEEKKRKKKKKSKTQMEDSDVTEEVEVPVEEVSLSAGDEGAEGKRKRKKKKSKDKNPSENDCMNETAVSIPEEDTEVTHKSKKKKKKHDKDRNSEECPPVEDDIIDIQVRKKHKKSKKVQRDPEEQMTLNEKENMESVVNESVDRSEEEKKTKKKKKKKSHPEVSEDQELSDSERHNEPKKKKRKKDKDTQ